ncbi:hypothetical protein G4D82_04385 [Flavobacterium sp. CYK-4]|uniref:hypothetical protein n=1 Tax=Flavobacterium lotistagni TaxID=2709660 RepID=UPI00140E2462|nr:hypothetical protein [Flavobacterium lotistagni]NHM06449.1 hypothetical protein [Flavobacterium lotistagni]
MRVQDIIPISIRKSLLKIHQSTVWPKALKAYKECIAANQMPSEELIKKLVYGWGNQGFSAQIDYIKTCIDKTMKSEGLIFECGSGLSTILLGIIAQKQGRKMVSFEHIDFWAARIQKELDKNQMTANTIYTRGLKDYGAFAWYDIDGFQCEPIGLCICDAPPGNTKGGRRGFLYLFREYLKTGAIILVDDTIREDEQLMIQEWEKELPMSIEFSGVFDPHAILRIY